MSGAASARHPGDSRLAVGNDKQQAAPIAFHYKHPRAFALAFHKFPDNSDLRSAVGVFLQDVPRKPGLHIKEGRRQILLADAIPLLDYPRRVSATTLGAPCS